MSCARFFTSTLCSCSSTNHHRGKHRRHREYVGPDTAEIVVDLYRPEYTGIKDNRAVEMRIRRHACTVDDVAILKPYANEKDVYYFSLTGEFISDAKRFPKGFYIADIYIDGCLTDSIEVVKAPGIYIGDTITTHDQCFEGSEWVEPDCTTAPPPQRDCDRKPCEPVITIKQNTVKENYLTDLSGIFEDD